jgi:hypothetical protein
MISLFLVLTMLTLGTINFGAQVVWTVQAFVDNRSFPAGSAQWMKQTAGYAPSQISNICCIIATFLSDGILVSNTKIVPRFSIHFLALAMAGIRYLEQEFPHHGGAYHTLQRRQWYVYTHIIFPESCSWSALAMSIIYIYGTSHTNQAPFDSNVIYVIYGILLITSMWLRGTHDPIS